MKRRMRRGNVQFLVKWTGHEQLTWEPEDQMNLYLGFVKADQYIEQIEIRKLQLCNTMGPVMNIILQMLQIGYQHGEFLLMILHFFVVVEWTEENRPF